MRYFGYSFGSAAAISVAMLIPPVMCVVGFFGAIPLAILMLPLVSLPHAMAECILVFAIPLVMLLAHFIFRRNGKLLFDSTFTLIAAAWVATTVGIIRFLCFFQHGGGVGGQCWGLLPPL
jgi:hypothetical protein